MKTRVIDLSDENLEDMPTWLGHPSSCKFCLYWEHPDESPRRAGLSDAQALEEKRNWFRATREEWGPCGKLLYSSGRVIGYAQYAPSRYFPNAAAYEAGPVSPEATFLSCLFLPNEKIRRQGFGRMLLESILCELRARGIAAVQTFARRDSQENPSGPLGFYLRQGFAMVREDPTFPLVQYKLSDLGPPAARAG
ncbi:MAG: N-acetyltransferase family protein [Candidatus Bipolaricaulia bacterium]